MGMVSSPSSHSLGGAWNGQASDRVAAGQRRERSHRTDDLTDRAGHTAGGPEAACAPSPPPRPAPSLEATRGCVDTSKKVKETQNGMAGGRGRGELRN